MPARSREHARAARAALLVCLIGTSAPAASAATPGQELLRAGRYEEARDALTRESAANAGDRELLRDLGAAYLRSGDPVRARATLRAVLRSDPDDGAARYYLGLSLEESDSLSAALAEYAAALPHAKNRALGRELHARMNLATRKVLSDQAQASIRAEKNLKVESFPENSLAVLTFENISSSDRLAPLSTGLSAMLATDLSRVRALKLVEREKLPVILAELKLERSKAFDAKTTARVGKLLGARRLVKGLFVAPDEKSIELDATTVETKTGATGEKTAKARGGIDTFFKLEKQLVFDLVGTMGITLSPSERAEIEKTPTKDLLAFLAYSRGLDLEDGGDLGGAAAQYRDALARDPGFATAQARLDGVEGASGNTSALDAEILDLPGGPASTGSAGPAGAAALESRIRATGERTSEGFLPDFGHGDGWDSSVSPIVVGSGRGRVTVVGTLPRAPRRP